MVRLALDIGRWTLAPHLGAHAPLPPGSLGPRGIARFGDADFHTRRIDRYGPVFKMLWTRRLGIGVLGLERGRRLLEQHGESLVPMTLEVPHLVPKGLLRAMRGADHALYRARFVHALRPDQVDDFADALRAIIRAELAAMASLPPGTLTARDQVERLNRITLRSLILVFLGVDPDSDEGRAFAAAFLQLGPDEFEHQLGPAQYAAFDVLSGRVTARLAAIDGDPSPHAAASVLGRLARDPDPAARDVTMLGNVVYALELGRHDMQGLLRWVLKHLCDHPDVVATLRAADDADALPIARACVRETLRLAQAEAVNRSVERDFVFEGHRFPAGAAVRILLRESHRDPTVFEEPTAYRPCRFASTKPPGAGYAPWGLGDRRCPAASLTEGIGALFVLELARGFTWQVRGDGPIHHGKYHWEPAHDFVADLAPARSIEGNPQ